jgi:hypothetical protein
MEMTKERQRKPKAAPDLSYSAEAMMEDVGRKSGYSSSSAPSSSASCLHSSSLSLLHRSSAKRPPDFSRYFAFSGLPWYLCPQGLLLGLPVGSS